MKNRAKKAVNDKARRRPAHEAAERQSARKGCRMEAIATMQSRTQVLASV
jgi:hypothetical protein